MAKILSLQDMLDVCIINDIPGHESFIPLFEQVGDQLATLITGRYNVVHSGTTTDCGLTATGFYPGHEGQECPPEIDDFDKDGEWLPMP